MSGLIRINMRSARRLVTRVAPLQWGATHGMIRCKTMCQQSVRKKWPPYQKSNKTTTNKIQKQRSATHCDVRHGTSCCDVRRAAGSRGTSFSGDSYESITFVASAVVASRIENKNKHGYIRRRVAASSKSSRYNCVVVEVALSS